MNKTIRGRARHSVRAANGRESTSRSRPCLRLALIALSCAALLPLNSRAQQIVIAPPVPQPQPLPPPEQTPPAAPGGNEQAIISAPTGMLPSGAQAPARQPFQYGPVIFRPHLSYQFLYGNGILSGPGQTHNTVIQTVTPGIGIALGTKWTLDYTPSLVFYTDPHFRNTVDHSVTLAGATTYQDWAFSLSQSCAITFDPMVETAQQTDQQTYSTALGAIYQVNGNTTIELSAAQNILNVSGLSGTNLAPGQTAQNARTWSTTDWIDHHWGPNFSAGLGGGFGYVNVDTGPDMTYEQALARVNWHVVRKITCSVNGGVQLNQFLNSTQPQLVTPVFGISLQYQPYDTTTFILSANRTVGASYFANQVTESTGFNASFNQRFFKRFNLGLSGGYLNSSYKLTVPAPALSPLTSINREDNYSFFSASVGTSFLKRANASVFYSLSQNSSSQSNVGYSSSQVGFVLSYFY